MVRFLLSDTARDPADGPRDEAGRLASEEDVMHLRTVLCPVDLTPLSNRAVDLGVPEGRREALQFHVEAGAPADHILRLTVELGAKLVLMGCHSKGALERLFTRATAREVLHRSPCPVWFVTGSFGEEGPRTASASRAPST